MSNVNLGTGTFYITGNASGATNAANQANNALAGMTTVVQQNWWGIQNLGLAFAALPGAVAAGTGAAIKSAIDWEDAMAAVARTTYDAAKSADENEAAAGRLSATLLELSRNIPTDASELAQIAENAGALGVAQDDVAAFTETVANLANVTDLTAQTASVGLARIAGLTGVGAAGYDNLASSITQTGVATAATESDIVSLSTRIAGVAKVVGLTADEVIGIAAATRSAGVQTEAGGTAIQKTFLDINAAVRNGGKDLEGWAALAGQTGEQFRTAFGNDSAQVLVNIVQRLGDLNAAGVNTVGMLGDLGITESRQVRTLLQLAAAQHQNVNENFQLSHILGISSNAFQDSAAYSEMLERRYNTLTNQLHILQNQIFAAGQGFGSFFLPIIRTAVGMLQTLITTITQAPAPFKALVAVTVGLGTILTAVGAAALLIGPRILIAADAMRKLQASSLEAANAQAIYNAQQQRTTAATLGAIGVTQEQAIALGVQGRQAMLAAIESGNFARVQQVAAAAELELNDAVLTTSTTMGTMITWAGRAAAAFGWITLAITLATTAMAYFNRQNQQHQKTLDASGRATLDMINAMRQEKKGREGATRAYVESMPIYQRLRGITDSLGISQETLYGIISGGITDIDSLKGALSTLSSSHAQFSDDGTTALEIVKVLNSQFSNSAQEAGFMGTAIDDVNLKLGDLGSVTEDDVKGLKKLHDAIEGVVEATIALPEAVRAAADAAVGVQDAEKRLEDARKAVAQNNEVIAKSERDLDNARLDAADAAQAVIDAEKKLAHAQQDADDNVAKAEDSLADARDRRADTIEKISDLEDKLAKLRAGPSVEDLTKATNDLRQAQLNLLKSSQQVSDAQWQLNYLREEGASNRDISDAENTLEQAKIDQTDATTTLDDAEQKLADLRDDTTRLKEIADLERDLRSARRDLAMTDIDIRKDEQDLADAREQADGKAVIDAEHDVERARNSAADATQAVTDAERDLADARDTTDLTKDVEGAERDLEDALWKQAEANVEVRKQTALMNGQQWDASDSARALGDELGILVGKAPTDEATTRMNNFISALKSVPNIPIVPEVSQPKLPDLSNDPDMQAWGTDLGDSIGKAISDAIDEALHNGKEDHKNHWWNDLWDWLTDPKEIEKLWNEMYKNGQHLLKGLWDGMWALGVAIGRTIDQKFHEWILDPIKKLFGIQSPSTVMFGIGNDIMQGLINGISSAGVAVFNFFASLPGRITGMLAGAGGWLVSHGMNIIGGLVTGIGNKTRDLWNGIGNITQGIVDSFKGAGSWLLTAGSNIIVGLWNGIANWFNDHFKDLWNGLIDHIPGSFADGLKMNSPSKVFEEFGQNIIQGLLSGIDPREVERAMGAVVDAAQAPLDMAKFVPFSMDEILSGMNTFDMNVNPNLAAAAMGSSATTINNYDTFNLETHTDADPEDIVNTYVFAKRVRART